MPVEVFEPLTIIVTEINTFYVTSIFNSYQKGWKIWRENFILKL